MNLKNIITWCVGKFKMLQRLLITGLLSGTFAGIVLTVVHLSVIQPFIVKAEAYEQSSSAPPVMRNHVHKTGLSHKHVGENIPHLHEKNFHIHANGFAHVHPNIKESHSVETQIDVIKHGDAKVMAQRCQSWNPLF